MKGHHLLEKLSTNISVLLPGMLHPGNWFSVLEGDLHPLCLSIHFLFDSERVLPVRIARHILDILDHELDAIG